MKKHGNYADRTKGYFLKLSDKYADNITSIQPRLYENSARIINKILNKTIEEFDNTGGEGISALDVGNGGVLNYNFRIIKELVCADLYISSEAVKKYKDFSNVQFVYGDICDLNYKDSYFDVVIVQAVIHHLADKTYSETLDHVNSALSECMRVLKPGGRLLIMESTVVPWFEKIERLLYPFIQLFFKICKFSAVYQFSNASLTKFIKEKGYDIEEVQKVELDKYIWIMNKRILSNFTPCGFVEVCIRKK